MPVPSLNVVSCTFTFTTPGEASTASTPPPLKFNVVAFGLIKLPSSLTTKEPPPPPPIATNGSESVPFPVMVTPSTATSVRHGVHGSKSGSGISPVAQVS